MANQWFRMYSEFAFDPKVQVVTETLQRRYVMALCLHCDGKFENRPDDEIALALRVTVDEWKNTSEEFIKRGLFTADGKINGWEKRQYISDIKDKSAAERQKRYRERKRNDRNDTVTSRLPDTESDTESDIILNLEAKASSFNSPEPKKQKIQFDFETGKFTGLESYFPIWKAACPAVNLEAEIAAAGAWLIENPENRKSKYAAFLGRWLRKAQERAPRIKTGPPNSPMSLTFAEQNKIKNQQVIEEARRKYEAQPA